MRAGVFSGSALAEESEMLRRVCDQPAMLGADLCGEVSTKHSYIVEAQGPQRFSVVALDLGIKNNDFKLPPQKQLQTVADIIKECSDKASW
jgi:carbamoyl-phosphate synthase small subunit